MRKVTIAWTLKFAELLWNDWTGGQSSLICKQLLSSAESVREVYSVDGWKGGQIRLMCSLVTSIFLYVNHWPSQQSCKEERSHWNKYHKVLYISYKDHVTNEGGCAKIQQAVRPHRDLTILKRSKLQWYGHVSHSSGLAKTVLQGTVKGKEDKADGGRGGKTTSMNGQAWSLPSPRGLWRTEKNGEN